MFNYTAGHRTPCRWVAVGASAITLNIVGYSGPDIESLMIEVTNTGTAGLTARLAGKEDFKATINYSIDLDAPPYATSSNIRNGVSGLMDFYIGPTTVLRMPCIIPKVHYESAVGTEVKGSCDLAMNCLLGGVVTGYALGLGA